MPDAVICVIIRFPGKPNFVFGISTQNKELIRAATLNNTPENEVTKNMLYQKVAAYYLECEGKTIVPNPNNCEFMVNRGSAHTAIAAFIKVTYTPKLGAKRIFFFTPALPETGSMIKRYVTASKGAKKDKAAVINLLKPINFLNLEKEFKKKDYTWEIKFAYSDKEFEALAEEREKNIKSFPSH